MSIRVVLGLVAVGLFEMSATAQLPKKQLDRRDRAEPEVVVEAGGRTGTCDVVTFSPDGDFLFAGGDDKVIRVWPHTPTGLTIEAALDLRDETRARTLRWRAWREQRGGIKTAAISPDGKTIAVGGFGMRPATIAILERSTGRTLALTWPNARNGIDNYFSVSMAAFHPDGRRIAFATSDGSLWLWDPKKLDKPAATGHTWNAPVRVGKHEVRKTAKGEVEFNFSLLVFFPDATSVTSVASSGQVATFSLAGALSDNPAADVPKPVKEFKTTAPTTPGGRFPAALSPDRRTLYMPCTLNEVLVQPLDGGKGFVIPLPFSTFPRSLAVHPKTGQLAVAVASIRSGDLEKPRFYLETNDEIRLYADPLKGGEATSVFKHVGAAEAMAFHPTLPRLAIAGGDADEVRLLDLNRPAEPLTVVRGQSRRLWGVNISQSGNVIGVQTARNANADHPNSRGSGAWAGFDIPRWKKTNDPAQKWVNARFDADGWVIEGDKDTKYLWWAVLKNGANDVVRHPLTLDPIRDQEPTCFTFLPATDTQPTRVLVGHLYGVSLFELRQTGAKQARLYTGHAGKVHSVVAAADQTWFVTSGADHTVAAYSLEEWKGQPGLGAAFEVRNGFPVVTSVHVGSPAWETGLTEGHVIEYLAVNGASKFDRRPMHSPVGLPGDALTALKNPEPGKELYFGVAPSKTLDRWENGTTVRQRPLWKWFPGFDDDGAMTNWIIWMWKGSYYRTDSAEGDRMVGWHVNAPELDGQPQFYKLNQFQKKFHRRDVIQKLIATRKLADALLEAGTVDPHKEAFGSIEPAPIELKIDRTTVDDANGIRATITARPRGANIDKLPARVEFWLNDHRLAVWPQEGAPPLNAAEPFETTFAVKPEAFRGKDNQLTVLTFTQEGSRAEKCAPLILNEGATKASQLHGLSVGINDYTESVLAFQSVGKRKGFDNLRSAVNDANQLSATLDGFLGQNRFFKDGRIERRINANARKQKVLDELKAVKQRAHPDDLLIVFFAGHGDVPDAKRTPSGPDGARGEILDPGTFVFCCPDYTDKRFAETSISANDLFDALASINCRKAVLLDACHSGGAVDANVIRHLIPEGQGPFVMAACSQKEVSLESEKLGHGYFTFTVLEALGDRYRTADRNLDGILTADELFGYVKPRINALLQENDPGNVQTAMCFPTLPPKLMIVRKG